MNLFEDIFNLHTTGRGRLTHKRAELRVAWPSWSKPIEKVSQKYVPNNLKILQSSRRSFEKRMYSPRNVIYNTTELVYFLMNFSGRATRIGDQKYADGLNINAKMSR